MILDNIRKAHQTQPFHPFHLHLADGRALPVPHPEFLYFPPRNDRTVIVTDLHGIPETVDVLMIVSIKPMKPGTSVRRRKAG